MTKKSISLLILTWMAATLITVAQSGGGNYLDRLDFGNLSSESVHSYSPGLASSGIGVSNLTYRVPAANTQMVFTMGCSSSRQTYLTVKFWGNDQTAPFSLGSAPSQYPAIEQSGNPTAVFPNRFYYYTLPIPISWTSNLTSVSIALNVGSSTKRIYSVFTHTDPFFVPATNDPTGTKPVPTGQAALNTLSLSSLVSLMQSERTAIFGSGGYLSSITNQQIMPGTAGAPPECIGLDLWTTVSTWGGAGKTADQWRDQAGGGSHGNGYATFPEEMLSVLTSCYLLPPFTNASGSVVAGLDHYHDTNLLYRIELLLDGCTYVYGGDGRFNSNASGTNSGVWQGLTSTARATGHPYAGLMARQGAWNISLEGVDVQALGWSIVSLLNDPVAMPLFTNYLAQNYDGNLIGSNSILRAYGYEQMLCSNAVYLYNATGGTESQNMFEELGMYSDAVALAKLQALFPNASYVFSPATALNYAKQVMGVLPDNVGPGGTGVNPGNSAMPNYGLSRGGMGEAHGAISCGYDGNGYGQILPWLAPRFAWMAGNDSNADAASVSNMVADANATVNGFDQFLYPQDNASVDANRNLTADVYDFSEERYISYRDPENPQADSGTFNFNAQFMASDPTGQMTNAMALRSAYLIALNGIVPSFNASGGNGQPGGCALNYLRDMAAYERTMRSLAGVNPASLTPLPAEPGQPDYAWADVQAGSVAVYNHGERLFLNANFQNFEWNNPQGFGGMRPSEYAFLHYTTTNIERAGLTVLPYNNANVQSDGNLSSSNLYSTYVVRYGNYLVVLNNSTSNLTYSAKLPVGVGQAQDLISRTNFYTLGSTVAVGPGKAAIFWLMASNSLPYGAGGPTIATPAVASANPVAGTSVNLSVLGASGGGESSLTYTWALAGSPPSPVTFSANGSNAAKNTTATFSSAGTYYFVVVIQDTSGYMTNSSVTVTVNQTASGLVVSPASVTLLSGQSQQFSANGTDQFGYPMQSGLNISWTLVSGVGGISSSGLYLAPTNTGGSAIVRASSGALSANATVSVPAGPIGTFSGALDIGSPSPAGASSFNSGSGVYTVTAGGSDIWNTGDQFRYVCVPISSDCTIVARVASVQNINQYSKGGVMIRETLNANSTHAFVDMTPTTTLGSEFIYRTTTAGSAASTAAVTGITPPRWVKLVRSGSLFTGMNSADGVTWVTNGTVTITMATNAYVGLAVCSHANGTSCTATFDNVSITDSMTTPVNLAALAGDSVVTLGWTGSMGANGYNVGRSTTNNGPYTLIGSCPSASFIDTAVTNGTTYYYVVSAFDFLRQTANSTQVSATPNTPPVVTTRGDLIVNLQSEDLGSSTSIWTNRTSNPNTVGNFTTIGGANLNTKSVAYNGIGVNALGVNRSGVNAVQSALLAPSEITGSGTVSVEAWIYPTNVIPVSAVLNYGNQNAGQDRDLNYSTGSQGAISGNFADAAWTATPVPGAWKYVTYTYDGTTFRAYLNGVLDTAAALSLNTARTLMQVGSDISGGGTNTTTGNDVFQGYIAVVRVESGILSATDITNNYNAGLLALASPSKPKGLTATAGNALVVLNWNASTNASSYFMANSTVSGGPYSIVATNIATLSFTNTGLSNGTTYYFVVSATNTAGGSANSLEASATPQPPIPSAPTGLTAQVGDNQVPLSWNSSSGATSYNVKRSMTSLAEATITNVVVTNCIDTAIVNGTLYYYVVSAVNGGGESINSVEVVVRPTSQSAPQVSSVVSGGQLQLSWPQDHTGWTLLAQTNPLNNGLGTNWVPVANSTGTNQISIPIGATNGSVFFRLNYQ